MALRRILIMAGGTGGHVFPALAVAHGLQAQGWQVDWMGTERGIEARVVPENGIPLHALPVRGLRGKGLLSRLAGVLRLIAALWAALGVVRRTRPNVVLGMGGYAAGPGGIAARALGKPLVIHEQNAVAGTTNRLLAPLASRVLCGIPGAFPGRDTVLIGNPVREQIVTLAGGHKQIPVNFDEQRPMRLLVLGGSLGAMPLNQGVPAALGLLDGAQRAQILVRHQCGRDHEAATKAAYADAVAGSANDTALAADVMPFVDDMAALYAWADLVICRAGALTVSELAVSGCPSILVPLPHAIDDHQTQNARSLSDQGAATLLPQAAMTPDALAELLSSLLSDPAVLSSMAEAAQRCARPTATDDLIAEIKGVARA